MPCSFRFSDGICIETEYKGQLCIPILISDREFVFKNAVEILIISGIILLQSYKEDTLMFEVTKDTVISDIMMEAPDSVPLFQEIGMHCMGCALASGENVEEACSAHGVDVDAFLKKLNAFIAEK